MNHISKKLKWAYRSAASTQDGSQGEKPTEPPSRSSTVPIGIGSSELRDERGASNGQTASLRAPSPAQARSHTINVVLFGETGVGKSSVINLIARREIAKVSSDVNGCTMQYQRYDIPFDNMDFAIFDTIGLEEPQMGVNGYLKAIEKAYELISKLSTAGGIHLLLFCMRGGRITATTQSNYRLFCECLCNTKVPIALVFTGLEREVEMEDWWKRNRKHIEDYGIKSDGHACITAVQDDAPGEDLKYNQSQQTIRELLKDCARIGDPFALESLPWFAKLSKGMRSFIMGKKSPKKKDVMKVLTQRCKLDAETAKKITIMMESGDTETNKTEDPPAGTGDGDDKGSKETSDGSPPDDHGDLEATVRGDDPLNEQSDIEGLSDVIGKEGRENTDSKLGDASRSDELSDFVVVPDAAGDQATEDTKAKMVVAAPSDKSSDFVVVPGVVGNEGGKVTSSQVAVAPPPDKPSNVKVAPGIFGDQRGEVTKAKLAAVSPDTPRDFMVVPDIVGNEGGMVTNPQVTVTPPPGVFGDQRGEVTKMKMAVAASSDKPRDFMVVPDVVRNEGGKVTNPQVTVAPSPNKPSSVKAASDAVRGGEVMSTKGSEVLPTQKPNIVKAASGAVGNDRGEAMGKKTTLACSSANPNSVRTISGVVGNGRGVVTTTKTTVACPSNKPTFTASGAVGNERRDITNTKALVIAPSTKPACVVKGELNTRVAQAAMSNKSNNVKAVPDVRNGAMMPGGFSDLC